MPHTPVLLDKVLEFLSIDSDGFVVDGTVDGGGHGLEIVKRLGKKGIFLGIDRDIGLLERLTKRVKEVKPKPRIILHHGNYAELAEILRRDGLPKVNGLLLDLGFSSEQLASGRGFSFQIDGPLDMRYDQSKGTAAAEILNSSTEDELADIFFHYGEERLSRKISRKIVESRKREKILTTLQLVDIVRRVVPMNYERGRINPATRVFQALRIYVNDELGQLQAILDRLPDITAHRGRVVIISFHSLEDRVVKRSFQSMSKDRKARILTRKPVVAGEEEIVRNPRSRSAKLRAIEII